MIKFAYAYASGHIRIGSKCPENALVITSGEEKELRKTIGALSRRGYKRGVHLVPGIPEAVDQRQSLKALIQFRDQVTKYLAA